MSAAKDVDEAWAMRQVLKVELRAVIMLLERGHVPAALDMLRGMQTHEDYPWTNREAALDALTQAGHRDGRMDPTEPIEALLRRLEDGIQHPVSGSDDGGEENGLTPYEDWLFHGPYGQRMFRICDHKVIEAAWNAALAYVRGGSA